MKRAVRFPLVIRFSIGLHLLWGVLVWREPQIMQITALYMFPQSLWMISLILIGTAGLALVPFYLQMGRKTSALFFFPQQTFLYISALGAAVAAIRGHYGDGVEHPQLFIFADQWSHILLSFYHTKAVIRNAKERA